MLPAHGVCNETAETQCNGMAGEGAADWGDELAWAHVPSCVDDDL